MKHSNPIKLAIISPCYNEESILDNSCDKLLNVLRELVSKNKIKSDSFILLVDDGSMDNSWSTIQKIHSRNSQLCAICLSRNFGHQSAIMAGLLTAKEYVDVMITIDVDLQDDINVIEKMIDKYYDGAEIVYGIKVNRKIDPFYKRTFAAIFYKTQKILGIKSINNHADFRLMSRRAVETLSTYNEANLYLRGIIPILGFETACVEEVLSSRLSGKSKFTTGKQIRLAIDGITSFSTKPLEFIFLAGLIMMGISVLMLVYVLSSILFNHYMAGWASLMMSLWFIGAVLTMSIGLIGIYIGKIYIEVKKRPLYTISSSIGI